MPRRLQDGFPRTVGQAEALAKSNGLDIVVNILLPEYVLVAKMLGRRSCDTCGKNFNVANIQGGTPFLVSACCPS